MWYSLSPMSAKGEATGGRVYTCPRWHIAEVLCDIINREKFLLCQRPRNFQRNIDGFHKPVHTVSGIGQIEPVEQK